MPRAKNSKKYTNKPFARARLVRNYYETANDVLAKCKLIVEDAAPFETEMNFYKQKMDGAQFHYHLARAIHRQLVAMIHANPKFSGHPPHLVLNNNDDLPSKEKSNGDARTYARDQHGRIKNRSRC